MIKKKKTSNRAKHTKHEISPKLSRELFPDPIDLSYQNYTEMLKEEIEAGERCKWCGNLLKERKLNKSTICEDCQKELTLD